MTYDHWKSTDPADETLGPDPELYAARAVITALTAAWEEINALGGVTPKGDKWSAGYNAGIDAALEVLEARGVKTRCERRKEEDR
jgi:hypothetical protein